MPLSIFESVDAILARDPAARSRFEVLTCYPGLHALAIHRISHALWASELPPLRWLGRYLASCARFLTGIEIHPGAQIGRRVFIDHGMGVVIGETAVIGDDCTIYQGVTLGGTSLVRGQKRHPTLEAGVVVGAGAKVLGPFTVGEGARIGSNAVVVGEIPKGATAVGIPARLVGKEVLPPAATAQGLSAALDQFTAYGVIQGQPDPIDVLMHQLMDELKRQQQEIAALKRQSGRS